MTSAPTRSTTSKTPPGSNAPRFVQTASFVRGPIDYLDQNHRKYGDIFTVSLIGYAADRVRRQPGPRPPGVRHRPQRRQRRPYPAGLPAADGGRLLDPGARRRRVAAAAQDDRVGVPHPLPAELPGGDPPHRGRVGGHLAGRHAVPGPAQDADHRAGRAPARRVRHPRPGTGRPARRCCPG
ncbi:hypothetical protein V2I01_41715 [Micromonospora sp. BRA006-A]|nr:hypothetical protein [Micromonospora sp. BRA006-A]